MTRRVDSHMHLWQLVRGDYGWLTPDLVPLYRDFGPADAQPLLEACGIDQVVLVQAAPSEAETRHLCALARELPHVAGVVGWVDFEAADAPACMAALQADCGGLLKGLRPMVQDIADAQWLARPALDRAFDAMVELDLRFDALVRPAQLPALVERLQRHPRLRAVIDHAGKPALAAGVGRDWTESMARAADLGACCKFSGLLTECAQPWHPAALLPVVGPLFDLFGPERILWGSDWPVLLQSAGYARWLALAAILVDEFAPGQAAAVFGGNAIHFYGLGDETVGPGNTAT